MTGQTLYFTDDNNFDDNRAIYECAEDWTIKRFETTSDSVIVIELVLVLENTIKLILLNLRYSDQNGR